MKPINVAARALRDPLFKPRRERAGKGKGAYRRRPKHKASGP